LGLAIATLVLAVMQADPAWSQTPAAAVAEGEALAFDRGKGNCLACHQISRGDLTGNVGPALDHMKARFPDRKELYDLISDESKRNPQTVMPPFGTNHILTPDEINKVIDFLYSL
jgi:sulfur-oxidizing protein SoxX